MMPNTCLLLKPYVTGPSDVVRQQKEIKNYIRPAIKRAGFADDEGVAVKDVSRELIRQVYEAGLVVIDINGYETANVSTAYLYYLMALCHSLGNRTILVASAVNHLVPSLQQRPHTLTYDGDEIAEFFERFERVAQEIAAGATEPGNPIQEYQQELVRAEKELARVQELGKAQAALAEKEAELERLRQRAGEQPQQTRIAFRPVGGSRQKE